MRLSGLILITLSFLGGAYFASLDPITLAWTPYLILLFAGIVGVALVRWSKRAAASAPETIATGTRALDASLTRALSEVELLISEKESISVYDIPARIDHRIVGSLNEFVAHRDTMKTAFGLQAFAEVMSRYAGGERYLNRVWSASVDGYIDEAHTYLDKAREQFAEAHQMLSGYQQAGGAA